MMKKEIKEKRQTPAEVIDGSGMVLIGAFAIPFEGHVKVHRASKSLLTHDGQTELTVFVSPLCCRQIQQSCLIHVLWDSNSVLIAIPFPLSSVFTFLVE